LVSEIIAVNTPVDQLEMPRGGREVVTSAQRTGSRVDPLGILRNIDIYQSAEDPHDWTATEGKAARRTTGNKEPILFTRKRGDRAGKPSVINHGNVTPSIQPLGITCDYAEHVAVITLAGLRRLAFGSSKRDQAGRSVLAALGLIALTEQDARGYSLRSRCDLVCEGREPLELVHADGTVDRLEIGRDAARRLYTEACEQARDAGFNLAREPVRLAPQDKLVEIVHRSQGLALRGEGGEPADES
jgi:CRISPR-associated protein Csb1